jgi:hypothetical protein
VTYAAGAARLELGVDCAEGDDDDDDGLRPRRERWDGVKGMSLISSFLERYGMAGRRMLTMLAQTTRRKINITVDSIWMGSPMMLPPLALRTGTRLLITSEGRQ